MQSSEAWTEQLKLSTRFSLSLLPASLPGLSPTDRPIPGQDEFWLLATGPCCSSSPGKLCCSHPYACVPTRRWGLGGGLVPLHQPYLKPSACHEVDAQ